ncbi:MAG: 50S ribosomal protein L6 [Alphaproteobacteria bacterium]|nr:50S ribosomal protein L6 [Alphaproteobacteria bacterium]
MSRVGKYAVAVPKGVTVDIAGQRVKAKGKLGELSLVVDNDIEAKMDGGAVKFTPRVDTKRARTMWGTTRSLVNSMVKGVADGFTINLEINGVGYRAAVQGKVLQLTLGYSHEIKYPIPEGITMKCEKPTSIAITGADKQKVGQVAAEIRTMRPPEPYKGKGIKYDYEIIRRKEGKRK